MRSILLILVALLLCIGCKPQDVEPPDTASFYYRSDGTRRIPPTAVPKVSAKIADNALLVDRVRFTTTPLALPDGQGFVIGASDGGIAIFGGNDSLRTRVKLTNASPVFRLAANNKIIVALQNSGAITALTHDGKVRWQTSDPRTRADMIITGNDVYVIADQGVVCYDAASGTRKFDIATTLTPVSAASIGDNFFVALSWNTATGSDSLLVISHEGRIERRFGFEGLRITSNIAVTGEGNYNIFFGAQGELDASDVRRRAFILGYKISGDEIKETLRQDLEYIPTNVSVSNDIALASGFQMAGDEYSGAIDAFVISTNEKLWKRRFTEMLASPIAVTTQHAFFPLAFASKADIPSSSVFIALDLPDGATAREFAVEGARNGFVPGLPMPYAGSFLLADAMSAIIYKLTTE